MKKYFIVFLIVVGAFFLAGCNNNNQKDNSTPNGDIELIPNSYHAYAKNECTPSNELYFNNDNYTYYKVCIDYIELNFKDTKLVRNLNDSILANETTLDDLLDNSQKKEKYGLYDIYFFDNFKLAVKEKSIYLLSETINYRNYLDSIEK